MTPDLPRDPDRDALEAALAGRGEYELFACDPALADTATFCAAYGFDPADSANTIVVVGKGTPPVYAACVVLATHRLAVNQSVKARFGRKSSFASPEETQAITGHEIGGVTVFGLPPDLPVWVDAAVMDRRADRPRWWQPQLEGDRARIDPADAAQRGGGRGAGEPGSPARGLTRLRWAHDEQGTPAHRGRVRHRPGGRGDPRDEPPRRGRGRWRLAEPGRRGQRQPHADAPADRPADRVSVRHGRAVGTGLPGAVPVRLTPGPSAAPGEPATIVLSGLKLDAKDDPDGKDRSIGFRTDGTGDVTATVSAVSPPGNVVMCLGADGGQPDCTPDRETAC